MKEKILVLDDDPMIRTLVSRILSRAGYEVTVVEHGEEALARIADERPALFLLDMTMPGMSGLDVLKALKTTGVELTVLLMSGFHDPRQDKELEALGVRARMNKPFSISELSQTAASLIA